jgi:hypothetical protein
VPNTITTITKTISQCQMLNEPMIFSKKRLSNSKVTDFHGT